MAADFDAYLRALAKTSLDQKTEHTDRSALEALLKAAADDAEPGAYVQHEPRRDKAGAGSPDYKITRGGRISGYVEAKKLDENLSKVLKSDQIKKYRGLTDNLILTDYLEFIWIKPGADVLRARLAHSEDLSGRKIALQAERVEAVRALLRGFFSAAPARIGRGPDLAVALARRAALLRDFLSVELQRQTREDREGRLHALYDVFRSQVFHDLAVGDFADAFAQMLAYGLFLARLNAGEEETVTLENVRQHIPGSFALIRELVRFLEDMNEKEYREIRWVIDEVLSIVNGIDLAAIHTDLSFRARKAINRKVRAEDEEEHRLFERDPFIYFYEDFLKAYDPAMRKSRGVYYTPPPVVNFIIRAIDDILKDTFGIDRGLADHEQVTVLDFACGTGTFLIEAFEKIFETIGGSEAGQADQIVREHLTKNLYGFEYLIAPYTIAHLKLSQYLKDKGHPLKDGERLQVFLTNTLEPVEPQRDLMLPALSREVEEAQSVKDKPILVITGNPPYNRFSRNKGREITRLIETYKYVDGKHFGERKHWLSDDYVKFIRFSENKMENEKSGIVGIVTNHSFLDNPTFRGMRHSLLKTFDQIFIFNIHGNSRRRERAPDGSADENVFDIEQGVSISLLVKCPGASKIVQYADLWGKQISKYKYLIENDMSSINVPLSPKSPMYFLSPHVPADFSRWSEIWSLDDIFIYSSVGMLSARDKLTIAFNAKEAVSSAQKFRSMAAEDARKSFMLGDDSRDWTVAGAQSDLKNKDLTRLTRSITYRPFDVRSTVYTGTSRGFIGQPANPLARAMLGETSLALVTTNRIEIGDFQHALVVNLLADGHAVASKETNHVYPLYGTNQSGGFVENIAGDFRNWLSGRLSAQITPEEVFGYIYGIIFARTYREIYADFLLIDAPRIPFPETKSDFDALSDLGWALVQAHLLKAMPKPAKRLGLYIGKGDHTVEAVRYSPDERAVWINKTQRFAPVPQDVWDFHIGGYQVIEKYLKSRKGRALNLDETTHVGKVAETLSFTIDQMVRIDEAYCAAFPTEDKAEAPLAPAP